MTKVQLHYDLTHPMGDDDLGSIARVHSVYGIVHLKLKQPSMDSVSVEYDASRMMVDDMEEALVRSGIPIVRS